jgi:seryl-tRNA synthetase
VLDPKFVRENPEIVKQATLVKRVASPELVDTWLKADAKRRNTQAQFDTLRNEQKKLGEFVGKLRRELKADTSPDLEKLIAEANAIKVRQDALTADLTAAESDCQTIYGETHSGSALRDFQSRRLNLRSRDKTPSGKSDVRFCYTLNNTAIACPRVLISIIEQYQNSECTVTVPEVLRSYMGNIERITQ